MQMMPEIMTADEFPFCIFRIFPGFHQFGKQKFQRFLFFFTQIGKKRFVNLIFFLVEIQSALLSEIS